MTQEAHEAFLIVRHQHDLLMAFEERLEPVNRPYYEALRRELTGDPGHYRGISRNPLLPLDYPDFACVILDSPEVAARRRFAEHVGARPKDILHELLPSHEAAREVSQAPR